MKALFPIDYNRIKSEGVLSDLRAAFLKHFILAGLIQKKTVSIVDAARIDPSVRFIGSLTNVWKKDLLHSEIKQEGLVLIQDCLKSNNLSGFKKNEASNRTSIVEFHGFLMPYDKLDLSIQLFHTYFEGIGLGDRLIYQVRSEDKDLLENIDKKVPLAQIERDTIPIEKLRHKFGHDDLLGRDIRVLLRSNDDKEAQPFAVLSVVDKKGVSHAVEMTYAPCVILKTFYELDHALDSFPLKEINILDENKKRIFEDCLIATIHLYREGLRPGGSENKRKILRQYVRLLKSYGEDLDISSGEIKNLINEYEDNKFGDRQVSSEILVSLAQEKPIIIDSARSIKEKKTFNRFGV